MLVAIIILIVVIALIAIAFLVVFLLGSSRSRRKNVDIHMSGGADLKKGFVTADNNYFKGLSGDLENTVVLNGYSKRQQEQNAKSICLVHLMTSQSYHLTLQPQLIIGRSATNADFVVKDDAAVSKQHCRLFCMGEAVYIEDMNSMNHTFVNNERVMSATRLKNGDTIRVAGTEFRLQL